MRALPFTVLFVVPTLFAIAFAFGHAATVAVPVFVFALVPLLDAVVGDDRSSPDRDATRDDSAHLRLLVAYAGTHLALTGAFLVILGRPHAYTAAEIFALTLSCGVLNGAIGITVAHELVHRARRVERGVGVALLFSVLYPHFRIEHVQGHHAHVATPEDPATARRGQSVYSFWIQSVLGGVTSAWRIEARRMRRLRLPVLHPRNRMIIYTGVCALLLVAIGLYSAASLVAFVAQSIIAFSLLEVVNYVEHYGLERSHNGKRYERVQRTHSWDSPRRLTNYLLINLQRHADHHAAPMKTFPHLEPSKEAPQLPGGYAGMVLLALVPPLWFRRIDPLLPERNGS